MPFFAAMALAVLSSVLYHLFMKWIPAGVHPLVGLGVAYVAAAGLCFALLPLAPPAGGIASALRQVDWTCLALAVAIVGIEAGYLLAYRAGWTISVASITGNAIVAIALLPVGRWLFSERVSASQYFGVGLCLAGLFLITRK
jgi:drug/metabolite transporter (DMT)-like permease